MDWVSTYPFSALSYWRAGHITGHPKTQGDVIIGNDVWIGMDAIILSGVRIGDGAVVAARTVVNRDVSNYSVVAGNPAREIRRRFDDKSIDALCQIAWWKLADR